jgi:hypothetical protein
VAITRIGSDHTPLLLNSGEESILWTTRFFFQTWWLQVTGFKELMSGKLNSFRSDFGPHRGSVEAWHCLSRLTRQFLKGWGANLDKEKRAFRANLLAKIAELDRWADLSDLDKEGWALRYHLEDQVIMFDEMEGDYWKQRSRVNWLLKGDACTAYFHTIANDRHRKCWIPHLVTPQGEVANQKQISDHIYVFYRELMGSDRGESAFRLGDDLWPDQDRISRVENEALELSFTGEELDEVLASMKVDSAPGPDGLPVAFFKRFRGILKGPILGLLNDFALGRVDIARLNFRILTLIPKV